MSNLFAPEELALLSSVYALPDHQVIEAFALLELLTRKLDDGTLYALTETRIEQSFNERLFAELFGYTTLFRKGASDVYHLLPKFHHESTRRYDDFALGHFGPGDTRIPVVSAELKGMGADLDALQLSRGDRQSAVGQAFGAVEAAGVQWIIVSNFDEMRLYRSDVANRFDTIHLSAIKSRRQLLHAYTLFSRETLLGRPGRESPLAQLWRAS